MSTARMKSSVGVGVGVVVSSLESLDEAGENRLARDGHQDWARLDLLLGHDVTDGRDNKRKPVCIALLVEIDRGDTEIIELNAARLQRRELGNLDTARPYIQREDAIVIQHGTKNRSTKSVSES